MAKNNPVKICVIKHTPNKDPKFHQAEMFTGAGRSTKALLAILIKGCDFRMFNITKQNCVKGLHILKKFLLPQLKWKEGML